MLDVDQTRGAVANPTATGPGTASGALPSAFADAPAAPRSRSRCTPSTATTTGTMAEREQRRWIVALLRPGLVAFAALCATFATAGGAGLPNWLFVPLLLVPAWSGTLVFLAFRSDTTAAGEGFDTLPAPGAERLPDRKATY